MAERTRPAQLDPASRPPARRPALHPEGLPRSRHRWHRVRERVLVDSILVTVSDRPSRAAYMRAFRLDPSQCGETSGRRTSAIHRSRRPRTQATQPTAGDCFWEKVNKTGTCWLWTGGKTSPGYGVIWADGRLAPAHRVSLMLVGTPAPDDLEVDHLCCVPLCVRPDHLEPVTHAVNLQRAVDRKKAQA